MMRVDLFEIYSCYISVDLYNYAVSSNVSLYILLLCQKFLYSIKRAWSAKSFSSQLHHKQKKNQKMEELEEAYTYTCCCFLSIQYCSMYVCLCMYVLQKLLALRTQRLDSMYITMHGYGKKRAFQMSGFRRMLMSSPMFR